MKNFYYVHNRGKGNCTYRHETKEDAIKEAIRLSQITGKNFYVLQPVAHIVPDESKEEYTVDMEYDNEK